MKQQKSRKILASSIQSTNPEPTRENKSITTQITDWIPFFKDTSNVYVNDLALRIRRSATTGSIINAAVNYSVGNKLIYKINEEIVDKKELEPSLMNFLMRTNTDNQMIEDVWRDINYDWKAFGNVYIEVKRERISGTDNFASNVKVHDATKCRINKSRTKCFISSFWRDVKNSTSFSDKPQPTVIDLWDGKIDTAQNHFVIHFLRKAPEYDYYGLPDYVATLKDADIEYNVDTYNLERLENGFMPDAIISLFGEPPEGMDAKTYINKLEAKYGGAKKGGRTLWQLLDDVSQKAQIDEFSGTKEGQFEALEESAKKGIMQGHRMHPILADVETAGKLGSSKEVINLWNKYMASVCIPEHQQPCLRFLNTVLKVLKFEVEVDVVNKPPIVLDIEPKYVLSVNEQREELGKKPLEELEDKYLIRVSGGDVMATLEEMNELLKEEIDGSED